MNAQVSHDGIFDPDEIGIPDTEAAKVLNVKVATLASWRAQGKGPRFFKVGRSILYTPKTIREFRESCARVPETAAARRQRRVMAGNDLSEAT